MALSPEDGKIFKELFLLIQSDRSMNDQSMNDPLIYMGAALLVALVIGTISVLLASFQKRVDNIEIKQDQKISFDTCNDIKNVLSERMDKLEASQEAKVGKDSCAKAQDLWGERAGNILDMIERLHKEAMFEMNRNAKDSRETISELSERIAALEECVNNLENHRPCK
jgi:hypothetical protein